MRSTADLEGSARPTEARLRFSVIVPTYDRPRPLGRCLAALAAVEPPAGGFEVIVVNDGGPPPDEAVVRACRAGTPAEVQVFDQVHRGPAAARNAGAERAAGTYLAFTDDDCAPDPLWLVEFDRALQAEAGALLGGRTVNALPDNRYSTTSQVLVDFVMGYLEMGDHLRFFTSNNIAMPRECFAELGGFDPAFPIAAGEDRDFCDRWLAEDWPMLRVPDAVVGHAHRLSLGRFLRQHFNYGRGGRVFRQVLGARGRPVIVDPGFYTASVWNAFREGGSVLQGGVHAALTVVAHAAYAGGMGYEFVRGGRSRKRVASPRTRRFIA